MQDGIIAVALINIIVVSLMMYHGTEIVVRNPVSHHHVFTMPPFTKRWRGLLLEFTLLSSYWKELSEGPYSILQSFQSAFYSNFVFHLCYLMHKNERAPGKYLFPMALIRQISWETTKKVQGKERRAIQWLMVILLPRSHPLIQHICVLHLSLRIPASQTFTGIQDNPTLMTTHIPSHFTDTYALGIFVISHMIRYHLHLSHLDEYFKTLWQKASTPIPVNEVSFKKES